MANVLVTGGTGYVGGWCIAELLPYGHAVRTTLRSLDKGPALIAAMQRASVPTEGLSFARADLTDETGWRQAMAGIDYVLHVASPLGGGAALDRDALVRPARDG